LEEKGQWANTEEERGLADASPPWSGEGQCKRVVLKRGRKKRTILEVFHLNSQGQGADLLMTLKPMNLGDILDKREQISIAGKDNKREKLDETATITPGEGGSQMGTIPMTWTRQPWQGTAKSGPAKKGETPHQRFIS